MTEDMSSIKEEPEAKEPVNAQVSLTTRLKGLKSFLFSKRNDVIITDIPLAPPRIKIEFKSAYAHPTGNFDFPWALISVEESFRISTLVGNYSFREESFESAEELDRILNILLSSSQCRGVSQNCILENLSGVQTTDLFLLFIEPSKAPIFRARDCEFFILERNPETTRCLPCEELFNRIRFKEVDVKPDSYPFDDSEDEDFTPSLKKYKKRKAHERSACNDVFKSEREFKRLECEIIPSKDTEEEDDSLLKYKCSDCSIRFRYGNTYVEHLFHVHHKDIKGETIFSTNLDRLSCPSCKISFDDPKSLEKHRIFSHAESGAISILEEDTNCLFECFDCGKAFSANKSYLRHRKNVHDTLIPLPSEDPNRAIDKRCYFCPRHFTRKGKLARHLHESHSDKDLSQIEEIRFHNAKECKVCDICGKSVRNIHSHKENAHSDGSALKTCPICGKLVKKISIRGHMLIHNKKSWLCSDCGQGFTHKTYLERHARIHDPEYKCIPCKFCSKLFGRMDSLNKHLKSAHLDQRDYICATCGKAFVCKSKLNRHSVVHSNQKSYPCEVCNYQCSRLDNLNVHRLKSHGLEKTTTAAVKERINPSNNPEDKTPSKS